MTEYKGLYNETGLDADYINVSILVCDSAELTNTVSQLTLHNTTISDIQTSPTRTLTVPNTAGNTQFVLESSVNTFTNTNTFNSITISGTNGPLKSLSGVVYSDLILNEDVSGGIDIAKITINNSIIPDTSSAYNLGSVSEKFNLAYSFMSISDYHVGSAALVSNQINELSTGSGITFNGAIKGNIYTGATPGKLCIIDSSGYINYQTGHGDISNDASGAFTLSDVNLDVGTYGDYANVGTFTVNAKGQITAAGNVPIIPSVVSPITPGSGVYSVLAYDSADGTLLSDPSYFRYDFENKNLVFPLASTGVAYMSGGNLITKSLVNGDLSGIRQIGYGVSGSLGWGYLANLSGLYNICIGHSAGYNGVAGDTSGSNNILIGSNVGSSLRGDNNVCLGTYAGNSISGNKNICIGNQAGVNVLNGHDNIYIGSLGVSGDNNVMRLGMSGTHTNVYMSLSGQSVMCISGTSVISRQIVNADVDSGALIDLIKINCNNNFVPSVSNTYNLGSLGSKWATAYIGQVINTVLNCSGTVYTDNLNSYSGGAITLGATLVGNISGVATYAEQVVINSAPASGTYNIPFLTGLFYGPINTDADFTYTTSTDTLAATNVRTAGIEEKTPAAGITLTGKINGSLSGAAYTASGITVNSTVSGTYYPVCVSSISGVGLTVRDYSGFSINAANGTLTATTYNGNLSGSHNGYNTSSANAVSTIVNRDNSGNFAANIITGTLSGLATTATTAFNLSGVINSASTATTQANGDNSTKVATTAYVNNLIPTGVSLSGAVNINSNTGGSWSATCTSTGYYQTLGGLTILNAYVAWSAKLGGGAGNLWLSFPFTFSNSKGIMIAPITINGATGPANTTTMVGYQNSNNALVFMNWQRNNGAGLLNVDYADLAASGYLCIQMIFNK
jgi:hypothetical protein